MEDLEREILEKARHDDLIPPCSIFIDRDGRWFYKGTEMIHEEIVRDFYRHLTLDAFGRYIIEWSGERCYVEVEDTAIVVCRVSIREAEDSHHDRCDLLLNDDTTETLSPETLSVGKKDVLYCRVKGGLFPARFLRPAYYQLASYIEEENGGFFLPLHGQRYPIRYLATP